MMRGIVVLTLLCALWARTDASDVKPGWHQEVGVKHAQRIQQKELVDISKPIVGGTVAPVNTHPYLAGLLIDIIGLSSPSACGGSLLTPSRILTAAHCWFDGRFQAWRFTVVLGSPFLFHGGLRFHTSSIVLHPHYNARTFANDVAMLYLPFQIPFSNSIRPLALPLGPLSTADFTGAWVTASGYGRYSDVTNPTTNTMVRNVFLQIIPLAQCRAVFGNIVLDTNICTSGKGGVGICQGDSGGPLTINHLGQDVLIGVSSFVALDGCELGHPSAFASVNRYLSWILKHL